MTKVIESNVEAHSLEIEVRGRTMTFRISRESGVSEYSEKHLKSAYIKFLRHKVSFWGSLFAAWASHRGDAQVHYSLYTVGLKFSDETKIVFEEPEGKTFDAIKAWVDRERVMKSL
jgi:hypothetical protein